ncbi:MAG: exostosin family protein [bacterium]|nr:exostosin family protein [bacterium]
MTKIYYNKKAFRGHKGGMTETVFCMPFEDASNWPQEPIHNNRFAKLIQNGVADVEYSSLEECDYAVLPYKYEDTPETAALIKEANDAGKKIIVIYNDDDEGPVNVSPEQGYVFRTSFNTRERKENEFAFPAFTGDFYDQSKTITDEKEQLTVGFCGQAFIPIRRKAIQKLRKQDILETNFILRKGFWAPELPKAQARREFLDNLKDNLFILCVRGAGNFSYRLYETMMMGRVPIIIDSDQIFPFEDKINYDECAIVIPEDEVSNIAGHIDEWLGRNRMALTELQGYNRQLWEKYLAPSGWLSNFVIELEYQTMDL